MYLVSLYYLSCICKKLKEDLPKIFQVFYIYYSENIWCCHAVSSKINTNRNMILKRRHMSWTIQRVRSLWIMGWGWLLFVFCSGWLTLGHETVKDAGISWGQCSLKYIISHRSIHLVVLIADNVSGQKVASPEWAVIVLSQQVFYWELNTSTRGHRSYKRLRLIRLVSGKALIYGFLSAEITTKLLFQRCCWNVRLSLTSPSCSEGSFTGEETNNAEGSIIALKSA